MLSKSRKRSALIVLATLILLFLVIFIFSLTDSSENMLFENYTYNLFCEEVSGNTISLHYTLKNPAAYDIETTSVSLGNISTDSTAIGASAENALAVLRKYNRQKLSDQNQLTYDILEDTFSSVITHAKYTLYDEPLAPLTGTQSQLPVILSEYQFYSTEDIDIYLKLLAETPAYFQALLDFEREKSKQGLFMASYSVDAIIEECEAFIELGEKNYLYSTFHERINKLNLSDSQRKIYVEENDSRIKNAVFPAYLLLKEGLKELRTSGKNTHGLCYLPNGKEYYELLVAEETGSYRSISELKTLTESQITQDFVDMQTVLSAIPEEVSLESDLFSPQGTTFDDSNPMSLLNTLREKMEGEFPDPPNVDIQIKYVTKPMEDYLSPAFYIIPPIDTPNENVIYINNGHINDDLSLFTTLAHEGYPGHLYQTTYFSAHNKNPLRELLDYGGYTEGWATYCEMLSYYYAPISDINASLFQKNSSAMLGLYALADIGIHYEGWTLTDTVAFFKEYGLTDASTVEDIYNLIIGDPGNYLKYYIGYVEFLELKKYAIEKWGNKFTQQEFHRVVLETGPVPFELLRKTIGDGVILK